MSALIVHTPDKPQMPGEPVGRLIYSREQLGELMGGSSLSSLVKFERAGWLTPITLTGRSTGQKFYCHEEVVALIRAMRDKAVKRKIKRRQLKEAA